MESNIFKNVVLAIIGMDGSGKSTQAKILTSRLNENGYDAVYVRPTFLFANILTGSKHNNFTSISPRLNRTSLFSKKRAGTPLQHIKKFILYLFGYPYALISYIIMNIYFGKNKILVCDRYFYQYFFDIFGKLSIYVMKLFPKPNISFFLDGDVDFFYSRMDNSFDSNICKSYYLQVLDMYRSFSKIHNFISVDAKLSREEINDIIFSNLLRKERDFHHE